MTRTEDEIRAALHGPLDASAESRLTTLIVELDAAPGRRARSTWVRLAPFAAAIVVVLVAVIVVVARNRTGRPAEPVGGPVDTTTSDSTSPHYLGPVRTREIRAGSSLQLDPPTGPAPRLTAHAAYQAWCSSNAGLCGEPATSVTIVLALLTTPNSGPARPDGTLIRPSVDHVLSYVIARHGVNCHTTGSAAPLGTGTPSPPARTVAPLLCVVTDPVSAQTGKAIAGEYLG